MKWNVPVELSPAEQVVSSRLARTGRFYAFLRAIRHQLFDEAFTAELERAYRRPGGSRPLPAAMLATVTVLQAYGQISDAEAVVCAVMDKRWQLVLGTLGQGQDEAPFSQGVLSQFRARLIEADLDQRLLDRTVELAKQAGGFGWQALKASLDSSPLLGAGRVEDSWNLIGRALRAVVDCTAAVLEVPAEQVLTEAGLSLLSGTSLKASLDIAWDDAAQKQLALGRLLGEVETLRDYVSRRVSALQTTGQAGQADQAKSRSSQPSLQRQALETALERLQQVLEQDLEPDPSGGGGPSTIRVGVAKDRMPSLGDVQMRHGRKSKAKTFTGYKRHIARLSEGGLIAGALVLAANRPEHEATTLLIEDVRRHGTLIGLDIDRGYLGSPEVGTLHQAGVVVRCKPWPSRNGGRFTKEDFKLDLEHYTVTCPNGVVAQAKGKNRTARFPASTCDICPLRTSCTNIALGKGRTVTLHALEDLLTELREAKKTSQGRAGLRERVGVEHGLARVEAVQGRKARYKGERKNTLDLRRCAAVTNLQAADRLYTERLKAAA